MIKILFVCHGNICRSPLAEFVMKDLVEKKGEQDEFMIASAGTSGEELGNPVHYGVAGYLMKMNVDYRQKRARQISRADYIEYDYIVCMEEYNVRNALRIFGGDPDGKISLLMDYTDTPGYVTDPYYYGNFNDTFRDVAKGTKGLYDFLKRQGKYEKQ